MRPFFANGRQEQEQSSLQTPPSPQRIRRHTTHAVDQMARDSKRQAALKGSGVVEVIGYPGTAPLSHFALEGSGFDTIGLP